MLLLCEFEIDGFISAFRIFNMMLFEVLLILVDFMIQSSLRKI